MWFALFQSEHASYVWDNCDRDLVWYRVEFSVTPGLNSIKDVERKPSSQYFQAKIDRAHKTYIITITVGYTMIRHGFVEKDIAPEDVHKKAIELLSAEGFKVTSDDAKDGMWDIHAKKSSTERIVLGRVRDVDILIAGTKGKFEVQLHAGIWGRDLIIPETYGIRLADRKHDTG